MKILVTGGVGFIGAHLVHKLIKNNNNVMVVDSLKKSIGGIPHIHPKCFFIKGDILTTKTLSVIKKMETRNYISFSSTVRRRKCL